MRSDGAASQVLVQTKSGSGPEQQCCPVTPCSVTLIPLPIPPTCEPGNSSSSPVPSVKAVPIRFQGTETRTANS